MTRENWVQLLIKMSLCYWVIENIDAWIKWSQFSWRHFEMHLCEKHISVSNEISFIYTHEILIDDKSALGAEQEKPLFAAILVY